MAIQDFILLATKIDLTILPQTVKERIRLPVRMKGYRLRSLEDRRHTEYIGGMLQVIPLLLSSVNTNNVVLTGRLDTVGMREWLGHDSFNGNLNIAPWEKIK